jgi:hypothetical protein
MATDAAEAVGADGSDPDDTFSKRCGSEGCGSKAGERAAANDDRVMPAWISAARTRALWHASLQGSDSVPGAQRHCMGTDALATPGVSVPEGHVEHDGESGAEEIFPAPHGWQRVLGTGLQRQ